MSGAERIRGLRAPANAEPAAQSPVHAAQRRTWNELHAGWAAQAQAFKLIACFTSAAALLATGGMVYFATQNRVVPYVVEVDKLGDALAVRRADLAAPLDPRILRAQLARWIADVRSVLTDVPAERTDIREAVAMTDRDGPAGRELMAWFSAHNPFDRARTDLVNVAVASVLPLSGRTWRIEWREDTRSPGGRLERRRHWEATITIRVNPPTRDDQILINPTGLYVEDFNWTRRQ